MSVLRDVWVKWKKSKENKEKKQVIKIVLIACDIFGLKIYAYWQ